jgi:hypothetical protein
MMPLVIKAKRIECRWIAIWVVIENTRLPNPEPLVPIPLREENITASQCRHAIVTGGDERTEAMPLFVENH